MVDCSDVFKGTLGST